MMQLKQIRLNFILILLVCSLGLRAQDVTFSHFLYSTSSYNPASTGIDRGLLGTLNYRRALMYLPSKFETIAFGMDQSLHDLDIKGLGGVGVTIMKNQGGEGDLNTFSLSIPFSGRVDLTENWVLQAGIAPTFYQKTINWGRLVFSDQLNPYSGIDPTKNSNAQIDARPKVNFFDFDIGLWARYESDPSQQSNAFNDVFDIGISILHIPEPNQSFFIQKSKLLSKYILMARYSHSINDYRLTDKIIQPVFLYETQGTMRDFVLGINYVSTGLNIGTFFRREQNSLMKFSELICLVGVDLNLNNDLFSKVRFNYSVDFFLSTNKSKGDMSHEVSLIFHLPSLHSRKSPCRMIF